MVLRGPASVFLEAKTPSRKGPSPLTCRTWPNFLRGGLAEERGTCLNSTTGLGSFSRPFVEIKTREFHRSIPPVKSTPTFFIIRYLPTIVPGLLPSDSVNQVPGEFSGFRWVNRRCSPRPSCGSLTTSTSGCGFR